MRRKDRLPVGVGKPDVLSVAGMESTATVLAQALSVSRDEIERREAQQEATNNEACSIA